MGLAVGAWCCVFITLSSDGNSVTFPTQTNVDTDLLLVLNTPKVWLDYFDCIGC